MKPASPEQAVFAEALQRATPEARAAYLDDACGSDSTLRRRVEALLRAGEDAGDFLEAPPAGLAAGAGSTILTEPASWTNFDRTQWVNSEYAQGYLEQADRIIPERRYLFHVVCSFLRHFVRNDPVRVCDLGCGDGALAQHILRALPGASLTLVDGAPGMLQAARSRLGELPNLRFVHSTFDALLNGQTAPGPFEVIVSSFAIHHLTPEERAALFLRLKEQLGPRGWFLNVDTVLPDEALFTDWQYELWREWIVETEKLRPRPDSLRDVPDQARHNPDNKLSRLASQLNALRRAGFEDVDCCYRNGIFAVYGGRTPAAGATPPDRRGSVSEPSSGAEAPGRLRLGLIGDYHPEVTAHRAIARSLDLIGAEFTECPIQVEWLPTDALAQFSTSQLSAFDGLWCVPASPYASMEGALKAIQFAREHGVPFLGTCAGFQHALIEYARNVLGLVDADHEETRPEAAEVLICRLPSPLVEREGRVALQGGTRLRDMYGRDSSAETYHCSFGLSPAHEARLDDGRLRVSARDPAGAVHAVELPAHPFFVATLFQPERRSLQDQIHPVVRAFVQAALMRRSVPRANLKELP